MPINWSLLQKNIFNDIANGSGHTVVIARAGAAKTSTLVEGIKYIPKKKKAIFVAFNKKIAEELDERINKSYIETRTLHSKGFATIKSCFGQKIALDPNKTFNLVERLLHEKGFKKFEKEKFGLAFSMCRAIALCKGGLIDIPSKIDLLIDEFGIDLFDMDRDEFIKTICMALRKCKEERSVIDYSDMIWFPYVFNMKPEQYDRVFIDEAQDLNPAQVHLALSMCKKDGRILACGDDRQVLYGFNGVEIEAINNLVLKLKAKVLPLSVSYRCGKNIVKLAKEIVSDIECPENAKEGIIHFEKENSFLNKVKPGDFILSRINAPLIHYCMALLKIGVPANIQGRDVGANLAYMIKKSEAKSVPDFISWLEDWKNCELARLRAKNRDPSLVLDKVACLDALCEGARSIDEVLDNIKVLFNDGDDTERVILSTVHRAKGLERDRVFLLRKTFKRGMNKEEDNIVYVAITRAKTDLFIIE